MFLVTVSSDPRGRACRAPADTDAPCSSFPCLGARPFRSRGPGAERPTGCLAGAAPHFPEDSRTSAPALP
ncbi:hypothetical protein STRIP9103_06020 [Streptomyces ipomoeae 91-03]|uniref:Uncharacterized protein n=1 Tax=Streptomyces ipomoeae 91-03 TaxID=698759 RepID=L1KQV5_9ACTN|nr:hypothetical protein STRIP9103_06020 [Streptomyces ipomoeae 91-03]